MSWKGIFNSQTPGVVLLAACYARLGADFMNWEPETLRSVLELDTEIEVDNATMNRLNAAIAAGVDDIVFVSPDMFFMVADCLNNEVSEDVDYPVPPSLSAAAWTVAEISFIRNMLGFPLIEWSHGISRYLGVLFEGAGMSEPPDYLSWAEFPAFPPDTLPAAPDDFDVESGRTSRELAEESREDLLNHVTAKIGLTLTMLAKVPGIDPDVLEGIRKAVFGETSDGLSGML